MGVVISVQYIPHNRVLQKNHRPKSFNIHQKPPDPLYQCCLPSLLNRRGMNGCVLKAPPSIAFTQRVSWRTRGVQLSSLEFKLFGCVLKNPVFPYFLIFLSYPHCLSLKSEDQQRNKCSGVRWENRSLLLGGVTNWLGSRSLKQKLWKEHEGTFSRLKFCGLPSSPKGFESRSIGIFVISTILVSNLDPKMSAS